MLGYRNSGTFLIPYPASTARRPAEWCSRSDNSCKVIGTIEKLRTDLRAPSTSPSGTSMVSEGSGKAIPSLTGEEVVDERLRHLGALPLCREELTDRAHKYALEHIGECGVGAGLRKIIRRLQDFADGILRTQWHRSHCRNGARQLR